MHTNDIILHLSLIPQVGPVTIGHLLKKVSLDQLSTIYHYTNSDFQQLGISEKNAQILKNGLTDISIIESEKKLLEQHQISYITILDSSYPEMLKQSYAPPAVLYIRGTLSGHPMLAIVGSRQANSYGQKVIDLIIPSLVHHGFTIVSGGAIGADTMAHRVTLKSQGKTIAVLGSGLLKPYPQSNRALFEEIVQKGGAVISSFNLTMDAYPAHFPARNRIIAGLSQGTVVVQAAAASGASITAKYALEYGREVFAAPGPINDPLSHGCHDLIQQGAILVNSVEDILKAWSYDIQETESSVENKQQSVLQESTFDPISKQILSLCKNPKSSDELLELLQIEIQPLQELLLDLQMQGYIDQQLNGLWHSL